MPAKPRTLGDWLRWAEARYARHRVALGQVATTAHDEALYLLLHGLGLPLDSQVRVLRRIVTDDEAERVEEIFERRLKERVPAAYLTREAWLGPHRFFVDERVIIPRSYFLELLPEQIPQWLPARQPVRRVADVCTGSGCLAVLLAHRFRRARVDAIEISSDALAVARFNVAQHRLASRIRLWRSDVFDAVPRGRYDLILSNPPYVPARELADLPPEFRREPALALDGGRDGFDVIRKLLRQARDRLQPHGIIAIEVGGLRAAMDRLFAELDPHWLHTADGEDCVCVIQQARLRAWRD
ncbi:MAG TPA: 50S ribosomal protein L3 N(5)-glutamine methyltransferase [Candidatus Didemnitutus sp.]|jgi:ribosomal protein L3 glutamine methyltransferase